MQRKLLTAALAAAALVGTALGAAAADAVVIGYQTTIDPAKVAQADGLYEKEFGREVDWRKFDSGADVIAAIAGGSLDIGFVGSSPLAVAASNKVPIETFFIADLIGDAEQLVVRNGSGIEKPEDLAGKTVAVPFVSTTHYSLLAALKHWGIDPDDGEDRQCAPAGNRRRLGARRHRRRLCLGSRARRDQGERQGARLLGRGRRSGARRPSTPGSSARTSPPRTPPSSAASPR